MYTLPGPRAPPGAILQQCCLTSREIAAGVLARDAVADLELWRIVERNRPWARRHARDECEDLLHATYIAAVEQLRAGVLRNQDALLSYIYAMVRRNWSTWRKQCYRRDGELDESPACSRANPEQAYAERERRAIASGELVAMKPRDREVIERFYIAEEPREHIERVMELSATQYRLLKSRAKEKFIERVRERIAA